mmetsp:Transcript_80673/g.193473  ORF Transcript_80673/g.193473 Transcript_80673/m.193473 type:complete len:354 (-) Transcript_80673:1856-2917(-)
MFETGALQTLHKRLGAFVHQSAVDQIKHLQCAIVAQHVSQDNCALFVKRISLQPQLLDGLVVSEDVTKRLQPLGRNAVSGDVPGVQGNLALANEVCNAIRQIVATNIIAKQEMLHQTSSLVYEQSLHQVLHALRTDHLLAQVKTLVSGDGALRKDQIVVDIGLKAFSASQKAVEWHHLLLGRDVHRLRLWVDHGIRQRRGSKLCKCFQVESTQTPLAAAITFLMSQPGFRELVKETNDITQQLAIHDAELGLLLPYVVDEWAAAAAVDISRDPERKLAHGATKAWRVPCTLTHGRLHPKGPVIILGILAGPPVSDHRGIFGQLLPEKLHNCSLHRLAALGGFLLLQNRVKVDQ